MKITPKKSEIRRLELLWAGRFGDQYVERNKNVSSERRRFWKTLLARIRIQNVLEVGCNIGGNLRWIADVLEPHRVFGIDINQKALREVRRRLPGINAVWSEAKHLPFRDGEFDLVFTAGVLIHQPDEALPQVLSEVVRCSRRYVLCLEYCSEDPVSVFYRGHQDALIKRNYGAIYQKRFPGLQLATKGALSKKEGWDDVTYWLFQKKV